MTVNLQADLEALYNAIIAKQTGRQVQSAGHKDKTASFAMSSLSDLIKIYRQLWFKESGLPYLQDLAASSAKRGPPARFYG